ncbi:MAG: DUF3108 domain-containing protein [Luteolibacter sp.]|uniref:DUF3108 domain-containing protein n=1 Tax=Luteolibacter sp. TaxID=1962973 RepID=UPI003266EDA0
MSDIIRLILVSSLAIPLATAAPTWQGELTSPAPGAFPKPVPSTLEFQVSWKGMIQAGTCRIEFAPAAVKKPGKYVVLSNSASVGAAALLFTYHSNFWSEIDPATLRPDYFHAEETDDKEQVSTTVRHFPTKVESEEIAKQLKSGTSKKTDRVFAFSPMFDIFSAMLHVRSQKLDTGDQIVLAILPFDTPYLLKVKVEGREVHEGRKAIRLTVGMRKIDRKTLELVAYKKLKKDATMWLSDDADRIPIELRAAVFIGDVRATLVSHTKP